MIPKIDEKFVKQRQDAIKEAERASCHIKNNFEFILNFLCHNDGEIIHIKTKIILFNFN